MMDAFTLAHLDRWLDAHVRADIRDETRANMIALVEDDVAFWLDKGWPAVERAAMTGCMHERVAIATGRTF